MRKGRPGCRLAQVCLFLAAAVGEAGCSPLIATSILPGAVVTARNEEGVSARIRIEAIQDDPSRPGEGISVYSVSVEDNDTHTWSAFCAPDSENHAWAIPIAGYWDNRGDYHASDSALTLACTSGVIAKCVRWGYAPWKSYRGRSLKDFHLACVRMARADFCGDGIGHTRDGTPIDVFDFIGIQPREQGEMLFEAAWSPSGATFLKHTRWGDLARVLAECPDKLRGRTGRDLPQLTIGEIERRFPESLVYSDSFVRDSAKNSETE